LIDAALTGGDVVSLTLLVNGTTIALLLVACITQKREGLMLLLLLLIVLILAVTPTWPYSRSWGYYPSGALGTVLMIVVVLMLLGRI
jgi:hypothetical protein